MIVGNRWEAPSLLPNRSRAAMADIQTLVNMVKSETTDKYFSKTVEIFAQSHFSENLLPANYESSEDVVDMFASIVVLSIRISACEKERKILTSLLYLIFLLGDKKHIKISRSDLEMLTDLHLDLLNQIRFAVTARLCMYIDHSGSVALRDNCLEQVGKTLSYGAETGRSVTVVPNGDDIDLVSFHGTRVFRLKEQTKHNPALLEECRAVVGELCNIIPPPREESDGNLSDEQLAVLPGDSVKLFLQDGRVRSKRRKRN